MPNSVFIILAPAPNKFDTPSLHKQPWSKVCTHLKCMCALVCSFSLQQLYNIVQYSSHLCILTSTFKSLAHVTSVCVTWPWMSHVFVHEESPGSHCSAAGRVHTRQLSHEFGLHPCTALNECAPLFGSNQLNVNLAKKCPK